MTDEVTRTDSLDDVEGAAVLAVRGADGLALRRPDPATAAEALANYLAMQDSLRRQGLLDPTPEEVIAEEKARKKVEAEKAKKLAAEQAKNPQPSESEGGGSVLGE